MVRVYDAKTLLQGMLYDAKRRLDDGDVRSAYNILKMKLGELDKYSSADYLRVRWD